MIMSRLRRLATTIESTAWNLLQMRGQKTCATKLPVELLQDVDGLGPAGKILKVNHGYARNFLVPQRLAAIRRGKQSGSIGGTEGGKIGAGLVVTSQEELQRLQAQKQQKRIEAAVKKLTTVPLTIRRKASAEGALDAPVAAADIADAVARQMQIEIVPELLDIGVDTLSSVGEYSLPLKMLLPGDKKATMDVTIVST